jgi:serine/threonine protein kinase
MGCEIPLCDKLNNDNNNHIIDMNKESYFSFSKLSEPISKVDMFLTMFQREYYLDRSYYGGMFGNSMKIIHKKDNTIYMMKIIPKILLRKTMCVSSVNNFYMRFINEYKHMNLNEIVKVIDNEDNIFIISKYSTYGNLLQFVIDKKQYLHTKEILYIINEVCNGLKYLHMKQLHHGNLCFKNIILYMKSNCNMLNTFITNYVIKLTDYSHCIMFDYCYKSAIPVLNNDILMLKELIVQLVEYAYNEGTYPREIQYLKERIMNLYMNENSSLTVDDVVNVIKDIM